MKQPITILILLFLASCQTSTTNSTQQHFEKTDTVLFTRYWSDGEEDGVQEYLVDRIQIEDSILTFRYYPDTTNFKTFIFDISADQFKLISSNIDPGLSVVDTFYLILNNEKLKIFKFEKVHALPDWAFGVLVNEKYGMIGFSAYAQGSKSILTRWNEHVFEQSLRTQLVDSDSRLLSRQNPIPPPAREELQKLDNLQPDTVEPLLIEKNY